MSGVRSLRSGGGAEEQADRRRVFDSGVQFGSKEFLYEQQEAMGLYGASAPQPVVVTSPRRLAAAGAVATAAGGLLSPRARRRMQSDLALSSDDDDDEGRVAGALRAYAPPHGQSHSAPASAYRANDDADLLELKRALAYSGGGGGGGGVDGGASRASVSTPSQSTAPADSGSGKGSSGSGGSGGSVTDASAPTRFSVGSAGGPALRRRLTFADELVVVPPKSASSAPVTLLIADRAVDDVDDASSDSGDEKRWAVRGRVHSLNDDELSGSDGSDASDASDSSDSDGGAAHMRQSQASLAGFSYAHDSEDAFAVSGTGEHGASASVSAGDGVPTRRRRRSGARAAAARLIGGLRNAMRRRRSSRAGYVPAPLHAGDGVDARAVLDYTAAMAHVRQMPTHVRNVVHLIERAHEWQLVGGDPLSLATSVGGGRSDETGLTVDLNDSWSNVTARGEVLVFARPPPEYADALRRAHSQSALLVRSGSAPATPGSPADLSPKSTPPATREAASAAAAAVVARTAFSPSPARALSGVAGARASVGGAGGAAARRRQIFRSQARVPATVDGMLRYLRDPHHLHAVMPGMSRQHTRVLAQFSPQYSLHYVVEKQPVPLSDRDYVLLVYSDVLRDDASHATGVTVMFSIESDAPTFAPRNTVRATMNPSGFLWTQSKLDRDSVDVTYLIDVELGGWVPDVLANLLVRRQAARLDLLCRHLERLDATSRLM